MLSMIAVLGLTTIISYPAGTIVFAQDIQHSEEYMQQHDGGDREEYLQELEHSDPEFYVPPVNNASIQNMDQE